MVEVDAITTGLLLFLLAAVFESRHKITKLRACFEEHVRDKKD